jgi:hypothetical protein
MNYAIVYLMGIIAFSTIYWYAGGRKFYTGPVIEAAAVGSSDDRSSEEGDEKRHFRTVGDVQGKAGETAV